MGNYIPKSFKNVSFRQLQVFERIADTGTFTAAAHELFLTQPTVSMQMKKLEEAIGTPLFEHAGRHVHLTHCGELLLGSVKQVFDTLSQFESHLASSRNIIDGTLMFAGVTTTEYYAPQLLQAFEKRYPQIKITLNIMERENLLRRLHKNRDNLYLIDQLPEDIGVVSIPFIETPLVVVAAPTHPLAQRKNMTMQDLTNENFVLREPTSGTRNILKQFLASQNITLKISMELNSNEAIKRAIANEMGLSVLAQCAVAKELEQHELVILDVQGFPLQERWYIVHSKDKYIPPAGEAFLNFLLEEGKHLICNNNNHHNCINHL